MGTAYSDQSASAAAYNSSPPPDDGSQVAANKVTWATHKTKIGDPLKAYDDAINTALQTALDFSSTQQTTNYTTQLSDNMKTIEIPSGSPTISLGDAATMTKNYTVTVTNTGTGTPIVALITGANTLDGTAGGSITFPAGSATSSTSYTFKVNNGATGYETVNQFSTNLTRVSTLGGYTPNFTSVETAIPSSSGATASVAHGLSTVPSFFKVVLRNKTTDLGYSSGDEVDISSSNTSSFTLWGNATNLAFTRLNGGTLNVITRLGGFTSASINEANWKVVFRAWK